MLQNYTALTASEIAAGVAERKFSAVEVAGEALELARTDGAELNAFISLCEQKAMQQAREIDRKVEAGEKVGRLAGVPIAIKDNINYTGYECTCGSRILQGYIPPYDATVVVRLLKEDAVVIGKTNMDEFAMGSSNENSYFGPVQNPRCRGLAPGGSSGGSAAVVAQGIVPVAFGSETGGSVRQPASFCGVYGLKPSYGGISRYGLVAFASSTDQIAPFSRNAKDLALVYSVVAGRDRKDSTSAAFDHPDYPALLKGDRKFRIGIPAEYFTGGLDPEVNQVVQKAIFDLKSAGHRLVDISLPSTDKAIAVYYVVACAEASANLARFDGTRYGLRVSGDKALAEMYSDTRAEGFGREVKRRIMLGTYALSSGYHDAYYIKASKVRELLRRELETAFEQVDLIICPTSPTPPFELGERTEDPLAMYLSDVYTVTANLAGIPAISVPYGTTADGRPVGVQFMSKYLDELSLFRIAYICEGKG